jgi:predicted enzyme related to lactoylglutathione lyase
MIAVEKVVLDVEDQERAREFWTSAMGFDVIQDAPYGEERWLEVQSPDNGVVLVLNRTSAGPGDRTAVPAELPTSNVMFACADIERTYTELTHRGVEFPQRPVRQPFGWYALFNDGEGNRFALSEIGG